MISSPAGNDLLFDDSSCDQGRNFNNKIWNALKLVKMWEGRQSSVDSQESIVNNFPIEWFEQRLGEVKMEAKKLHDDFRLSEELKTIYSLIWDDFCSWYLEWVKPGFEQPIEKNVYEKTVLFFEELMQLLHPFMPFITEQVYHELRDRKSGDDLTIKQSGGKFGGDAKTLLNGEMLKNFITAIRDARNRNQLKPKDTISIFVDPVSAQMLESIKPILAKQVNAEKIEYTTDPITDSIAVVVQNTKFYLKSDSKIDTNIQKDQLLKDLEYQKGFLLSVEKKLSNERFVQNAKPEVIEIEKKKKNDAEAKIRAIEESLASL